MTYERYVEIHNLYDTQINIWSDKLNSFPKLPDGRIRDEVKQDSEYQMAKKMYNTYFQAFRKLNGDNKAHMKQYGIERRAAKFKKTTN